MLLDAKGLTDKHILWYYLNNLSAVEARKVGACFEKSMVGVGGGVCACAPQNELGVPRLAGQRVRY